MCDVILRLDVGIQRVTMQAVSSENQRDMVSHVFGVPAHNTCSSTVRRPGELWDHIAIRHSEGSDPRRELTYIAMPCDIPSARFGGTQTFPTLRWDVMGLHSIQHPHAIHVFAFTDHQKVVSFVRFMVAGYVADCRLRGLTLRIVHQPAETWNR